MGLDSFLEYQELSSAVDALKVSGGEDSNKNASLAYGISKIAGPRITYSKLLNITVANSCLVSAEVVMNRCDKIVEQLVKKVCGCSERVGALAIAAVGPSVAEEECERHEIRQFPVLGLSLQASHGTASLGSRGPVTLSARWLPK